MSDDVNLHQPTINFDLNENNMEEMESIFTVEEDFDPIKACEKLILRESSSEKYVIHEKLAQGGMGAIYRVYDRDLKRINVLKVILPKIMENRQMFLGFIDEARITAQLEHPNIIPVHDLGVINDRELYFSMKLIQGEELTAILRRLRDGDTQTIEKYDIYTLLTLFRKVCDAMAFAHSRNIIHRDIKPENIMVGDYGEVLVVDWGLARKLDEPEHDYEEVVEDEDTLSESIGEKRRTRYGMIKGTPAFMSPEQATGSADEIDKRSDIFLLGSTLYTMATLSPPYRGDDVIEIIENAEHGDFEHPQQRAPHRELPVELCRIIMRAMAYEREGRYQSVEELIVDIDDLIGGRTASSQRVFSAGEMLMEQGDSGKECYVIITGEVEVFRTIDDKEIPIVNLKDGNCIGEMAMISNAPRSASVRAVRETHCVVITEDLIKQGLDKLPPWMGNVVQVIVERLRTANKNLHPLVNASCAYQVLNQLWMIYLCWGRPYRDNEQGVTYVLLDLESTLREITTNISLPRERVNDVVAKVIESKFIIPYDETRIYIPNLQLLREFIVYIKEVRDIDSRFDDFPEISLYANASEYVISQAIGHEHVAAELESVANFSAEDVLGCETTADFQDRFEELLEEI